MKWVLYGSKVGCLLSQIFFLLFQTKNFKYDSQVNVFPFLLNQIWKKEKQIEFHFYLKLKKNIVILLFKRAVTCTYIIIYVTAFNTWKIWKKRDIFISKKVISLIEGKLFLGHNTCTCMCLASPLPSGRGLCPGTHRRSPAPGLLPYASGCICKLLFNLNIFYWINQKYFKKQKPPKQFLHLRVPLLTCASPFCNGLSVDLHHGTPPDRRCR